MPGYEFIGKEEAAEVKKSLIKAMFYSGIVFKI